MECPAYCQCERYCRFFTFEVETNYSALTRFQSLKWVKHVLKLAVWPDTNGPLDEYRNHVRLEFGKMNLSHS